MRIIVGFLIGLVITNLIVSVAAGNLIGTIGAAIALIVTIRIIGAMK